MARSTPSKSTTSLAADTGNESFVQIQDQAVPYLDALAAASPTAFRVFLWLMGQANKQNKVIADQNRIGKELSLHRNTIATAVAHLRTHHFLQTYKAGTTTGYCLNAWVVWRDSRSNRATAPFLYSLRPQAKSETESAPMRLRVTKSKPVKAVDPSSVDKSLLQQIRAMERQQAFERKQQPKPAARYAAARKYEPDSPSLEELRASEEFDNDYGYRDL